MSYQDHVLADAPYAYWPMQDASSPNRDVVSGRSLTWNGGAVRVTTGTPAILGEGTVAHWGSGSFAQSAFSWNPTAWSVEWWHKTGSYNNRDPISGQGTSSTVDQSYWGTFCWHGVNYDDAYLGTDVPTRWDPVGGPVLGSGVNTVGVWLHHVATYASNTMIYYIDGVQKATKAVATPGAWTGVTVGSASSAYNFEGRIAHLSLHPKVLTAARIAARYKEAVQRGAVTY